VVGFALRTARRVQRRNSADIAVLAGKDCAAARGANGRSATISTIVGRTLIFKSDTTRVPCNLTSNRTSRKLCGLWPNQKRFL
jgi:hypothetical protein